MVLMSTREAITEFAARMRSLDNEECLYLMRRIIRDAEKGPRQRRAATGKIRSERNMAEQLTLLQRRPAKLRALRMD
jgi:hypothetical protein